MADRAGGNGLMKDAPAYNDGVFRLYDIVDDPDTENPDYPLKKIHDRMYKTRVF